ncbi:formimidoylglutamase [Galactobacter valiniphilus]|uniref:Formimidoylglutamase n=1 Tax=Galactobacter valiniphilus TaxID=2676122 RepID=A0A399J6E0_9MICC|nr:arginase family protein [Galactobacter valiniphilus]RII41023.1 formimidoylglutamase [Galactobacter valiniphilus]
MSTQPHPAWTGRNDGEGPEHRRWHQAVIAAEDPAAGEAGLAIVGFACDAGVARNAGRTGASAAPPALRRALAPLAWRGQPGAIVDAGDVSVEGDALEDGQARLGTAVARQLGAGRFVAVLGGGHETAWGSYLGLREALLDGAAGSGAGQAAAGGPGSQPSPGTVPASQPPAAAERRAAPERATSGTHAPRLGILNLDAHFDLREAPRPSSGTPFLQIARDAQERGEGFSYAVVGISEPNNTRVLFETADALCVRYLLDEDCQEDRIEEVRAFVREFAAGVDALYLTIDLDLMPAAVAPGVSAPAGFGVPFPVVRAAAIEAALSGKLALVDVVELNPLYDVDSRTAKAAARLLHDVVTRRVALA